jgi:hypothetical protein
VGKQATVRRRALMEEVKASFRSKRQHRRAVLILSTRSQAKKHILMRASPLRLELARARADVAAGRVQNFASMDDLIADLHY